MKRLVYVLPLAIFAVLAFYFAVGLTKDPRILPSVLIDQPVPSFDLPPIKGRDHGLASKDLEKEVSLVNIFGSWCVACRVEHPFLMKIKAENRQADRSTPAKSATRCESTSWALNSLVSDSKRLAVFTVSPTAVTEVASP